MSILNCIRVTLLILVIINISSISMADNPLSEKPFIFEQKMTSFVDMKDLSVTGKKQLNFTQNDTKIYAWVHLKNIIGDHYIRHEWYTPLGDLCCNCTEYVKDKEDYYTYCYNAVNDTNENPSFITNQSLHGEWHINVSLDEEPKYTEKFSFNIKNPEKNNDSTKYSF